MRCAECKVAQKSADAQQILGGSTAIGLSGAGFQRTQLRAYMNEMKMHVTMTLVL
jgi:hypothetical protein